MNNEERELTPAEELKEKKDKILQDASAELQRVLDYYGVHIEVEMTVTQRGQVPNVKLVTNN